MSLQPAIFTLDPLGDRYFAGYTQGETWNGWDWPYFTFEQGLRIVEAVNSSNPADTKQIKARYDSEKDTFFFSLGPEGDSDNFTAIEIEGHKYYPIGAGCWIWEREGKWTD
jgi:hypothetical protein